MSLTLKKLSRNFIRCVQKAKNAPTEKRTHRNQESVK